MLGELAVDLLSRFSAKLLRNPFGRGVGYEVNSLPLAKKKALAGDGAKEIGKHARPARPLGELHHAIPHLLGGKGRLERIRLGREIGKLRVAGRVLREIEAGFFVGGQFVQRLPGPLAVTAFSVQGRALCPPERRGNHTEGQAQYSQYENNVRFHASVSSLALSYK